MANNKRIIRGAYSDFTNTPNAPRVVRYVHSGPTLTQQEFLEECDINNVILRFAGTGELPPRTNRQEPRFADLGDTPDDLHQALNSVQAARDAFDALPDDIKSAVNYNPEALVQAYDFYQQERANPPVTEPVTTPSPTPGE